MKRKHMINLFLSLVLLLFALQFAFGQGINKKSKVGYLQAKVVDQGDEGEGIKGWGADACYYDGFIDGIFSSKAMFLGCKDFTDTLGVTNSVKVSGNGQWEADDKRIWMPVPDADGYTIHRYLRYQPPAIEVDGFRLEDPFPFDFADHVAPDKIPGTADVMIESFFNTDMGISVHQRVFSFSQKNHDDYHIFEWTFKNTGNVDTDPDIELNQTLQDVYYLRQIRQWEDPPGWASDYGFMPGDSIRILYGYSARPDGAEWDNFGNVNEETGYIEYPWFMGETILFGSDPNNPTQDSPNQPSMTGHQDCDLVSVTQHSNNITETQKQWLYQLMSEGFSTWYNDGTPDKPGSKPGHHSPPLDERGYMFPNQPEWFGYTISSFYAYGPYTLAPGDSFKVVWAEVMGTISNEKSYEVGTAWLNGSAQWGDMTPGGPTEILPPQYQQYPELYAADSKSTEVNNWAKDNWVFTGRDSLFRNASAALWAYQNDLNVPAAPPAPSISVTSLPDEINVSWGDESEVASDFAGYRVYRAKGDWFTHIPEDETQLVGVWEPVFECGDGTSTALTHEFHDNTAQRGIAYYYYVSAFDKAESNPADYDGVKRSLESSKFMNMTTQAAHLLKPAGTSLADIRIVPNPFNLAASEIQFTGEPDKIMFVNLPMKCIIKIFTEGGDLVKTIEHQGSGDEPWGILEEQHMVTDYGQQVVSGIYIAYIEVAEDQKDADTGQIVLKKGDKVIKKFVVVR